MAENVIRRKADGKKIGGRTAADVFVDNEFAGELEFILIGEAGGAEDFVEAGVRSVFAFAMRG